MKDLLLTIESKSIAFYNLKKQSAPKELLFIIKDEVQALEDEVKVLNELYEHLKLEGVNDYAVIGIDAYNELKDLFTEKIKIEQWQLSNIPIIYDDDEDEEDEDDYFYNDDDVDYISKKYKLQEIDEEISVIIGSLL